MKKLIFPIFIAFCVGITFYATRKKAAAGQEKFEWQRSSFSERGYDTKSLDSMLMLIRNGTYGYVNELLITQGEKILVRESFGNDYRKISGNMSGKMGCGFGACEDSSAISLYNYYHPRYHPYYQNTRLHTLQSITKSITATVVGLAATDIDRFDVEKPLAPYFTDWDMSSEMAAHLEQATIRDLLTMRLGLSWKEAGLTLEEESDVTNMELSEDWVRYVLGTEVSSRPDSIWNYSSGASLLLSEVIRQETGMQLADYAKEHLFKPLGIEAYFWKTTPNGLTDTEGGLYLKPEDLAKIGLLYLRDGHWMGRQLLTESWVKDSFTKHSTGVYGNGGNEGYGYQWWITQLTPPDLLGLGYGGQALLISPDSDVVVVINAWNVFDEEVDNIFAGLLPVLNEMKSQ